MKVQLPKFEVATRHPTLRRKKDGITPTLEDPRGSNLVAKG